jgi:hypothetical protein
VFEHFAGHQQTEEFAVFVFLPFGAHPFL